MPDASLKVTLSGSDQLSGPAASAASAVQAVKTAATGAAPAVNLLGQQGGSALVGLSADARAAQAAIRGAAADMESLNQRGQKGTQRGAELAPNLPLRQVLPDNWQQGTTAGSESLRAFTQRLGEVEGASDSARGKLASLGGQGLNLKGILGEVGRSAAGALGHLATGAAMAGLESVKAMWRDIGAATDEANAAAEKVGATYALQ